MDTTRTDGNMPYGNLDGKPTPRRIPRTDKEPDASITGAQHFEFTADPALAEKVRQLLNNANCVRFHNCYLSHPAFYAATREAAEAFRARYGGNYGEVKTEIELMRQSASAELRKCGHPTGEWTRE